MSNLLKLLVVLTFWSCAAGKENRPSVTVSIAPLGWIASSLVDSGVVVSVLVPSGSSPETYEPTARQIEDLARSSLYLSTGLLDFEGELAERLASVAPSTRLVNLSDSIDLLEGSCSHTEHNHKSEHHAEHGDSHGVDPHIWLSPHAMKKMIAQAATAIVAQGVSDERRVIARADSLLRLVDQVDQYILAKANQSKSFAIVHPSLSYFARDYGLRQIALEIDGKEPSAAAIRTLVDELKKEGITTIFYGIQTSDAVAKVVANEIGCTLTPYDPLATDWIKSMRKITDDIYGTN